MDDEKDSRKMKSKSPESGLDELMRLSQQMNNEAQELTKKEQQRTKKRQRTQEVLQGFKEISISVAVEQLRLVATPEITEGINSLKHKPDTKDLRKVISDLAHDLEKRTGSISASNPDMMPIERSVSTLSILIELFFSLE